MTNKEKLIKQISEFWRMLKKDKFGVPIAILLSVAMLGAIYCLLKNISLNNLFVLLKTNPSYFWLGIILILSVIIFAVHRKFVSKWTYLWQDSAFLILFFAVILVLFSGKPFTLSGLEKSKIRIDCEKVIEEKDKELVSLNERLSRSITDLSFSQAEVNSLKSDITYLKKQFIVPVNITPFNEQKLTEDSVVNKKPGSKKKIWIVKQ